MIGLEYGLGFRKFKKFPGDSNLQTYLVNIGLETAPLQEGASHSSANPNMASLMVWRMTGAFLVPFQVRFSSILIEKWFCYIRLWGNPRVIPVIASAMIFVILRVYIIV